MQSWKHPLFMTEIGRDPIYTFNRNDRGRQDVCDYCISLWEKYKPFCPDLHFIKEFPSNFMERSWEMYLGSTFLDRGFPLRKPPSNGPDILLDLDRKVWIEAVALSNGEGSEAVPVPPIGRTYHPDEEAVVVRLLEGIRRKAERLRAYKKDGIISYDDVCIIAVNLGQIDMARGAEYDNPFAVQALLGVGNPVIKVPISFEGAAGQPKFEHTYRPSLISKSERKVVTTEFLSEDLSEISAVMTSTFHIVHMPKGGDDLVTVANPTARIPLPKSLFPFGLEYYQEGQLMKPKDHRTKSF